MDSDYKLFALYAPRESLLGDLNADRNVNLADFSLLARFYGEQCSSVDFGSSDETVEMDLSDLGVFCENWLSTDCGLCNGQDFDGDSDVDFQDYTYFAQNWTSSWAANVDLYDVCRFCEYWLIDPLTILGMESQTQTESSALLQPLTSETILSPSRAIEIVDIQSHEAQETDALTGQIEHEAQKHEALKAWLAERLKVAQDNGDEKGMAQIQKLIDKEQSRYDKKQAKMVERQAEEAAGDDI